MLKYFLNLGYFVSFDELATDFWANTCVCQKKAVILQSQN